MSLVQLFTLLANICSIHTLVNQFVPLANYLRNLLIKYCLSAKDKLSILLVFFRNGFFWLPALTALLAINLKYSHSVKLLPLGYLQQWFSTFWASSPGKRHIFKLLSRSKFL
jgi:hypothetical protein